MGPRHSSPAYFLLVMALAWIILLVPAPGWGQQAAPPAPKGSTPAQDPPLAASLRVEQEPPKAHRFWDRSNALLFAGVGAARGLDYASTRNMRARGRDEILLTNDIVDNKPLFAGIEAAGSLASIGVSYWFHRAGHHRLERWVSILHITAATTGAARNYSLKTVHARPAGL